MGNGHKEYQIAIGRLMEIFDIEKVEVIDEKPVTHIVLNYNKLREGWVEERLPKKPEIKLKLSELKTLTEELSEEGVDVAEVVMRRISETYK